MADAICSGGVQESPRRVKWIPDHLKSRTFDAGKTLRTEIDGYPGFS